MKKLLFILIILTLFSFSISAQENKTALIIGNSSYKQGALKNPENDATAMADTLKSLGFNVFIYKNVQTQNDMKKIVKDFGDKLRTNGGVGLFYYSGHGIQIKGINYLMPVNALISSETDVEYEGLDFGLVLGKMEDSGTKLNICILDACRDNPFIKSFRSSSERGLAVISKSPPSTIIAYATGPGSVASDGTGKNGLYTEELLKALKTSNLNIEDVFKETGKNVSNRTNGLQLPWLNSSFYGEFSFISKGGKEKIDNTKVVIKEEPIYGSVEIEVLENGKLYIDNEFINNVTFGKKITINNIIAGSHNIEIRYDDNTENKNVFVEKDKVTALSFSYRKQEKPKIPENFVFVPGGTFKNTNSNYYGKNVTVSNFLIGKYEVTQKEWIEVMGNNPSQFKGDNLPVVSVNWYDCVEYCNKRSIKEGFQPYYNIDKNRIDPNNLSQNDYFKWAVTINDGANGYRLPTEAEWEYSASGGEKSNELGLYDMTGNVWEWCWDWWQDPIRASGQDPKGTDHGLGHIFRGGS